MGTAGLEIALKPFDEFDVAAQVRARRAIGVLPIHAPDELFEAMGLLPVRIWGSSLTPGAAHAHVQGYICSIVTTALEMALRGRFSDLAGLFLPSPCDSMNNLVDLMKHAARVPFVEAIGYPQKGSPAALDYLAAEMKRVSVSASAALGVGMTTDSWLCAVRLHNDTRRHLRGLYAIRGEGHCSLGAERFYRVARVAGQMDRAVLNSALTALLSAAEGQPPPGPRVVLSGIVAEPPEVARLIDETGLSVAADDLALGSRLLQPDIEETEEPFVALARRYLSAPACSTVHDETADRAARLLSICRDSGSRAVLFLMQKFCEPEHFDLPKLRRDLGAAGIATATVEVTFQSHAGEALRTRLAAFREMLERGRL